MFSYLCNTKTFFESIENIAHSRLILHSVWRPPMVVK